MWHEFSPRDNQTVCGFEGNSDIYGLGIRIGVYAQTLAAWIASEMVRHDLSELYALTNLFMSSILISLVWVSSKKGLYAVEAFLMLQILLISWFTSPGNRFKSRFFNPFHGMEGEIFNKILKYLILVYNVWFWWRELDRLAPTPCGTYCFFIVYKFNLYGGLRSAHQVLSILALVLETRRALYYSIGVVIVLRTNELYSKDTRERIRYHASARITTSSSYEPAETKQTITETVPAKTMDCTANASHLIKRRWSFEDTKRPTNSELALPQKPMNSGRSGYPVRKNRDMIFRILDADSFLDDMMLKIARTRRSLVYKGFKFGGSEFNLVSTRRLSKIYWQSICGFKRLMLEKPGQIQSIIIAFLVYDLEAPEARTHDSVLILWTLLQTRHFDRVDWKDLHLAAQVRANKVSHKRKNIFIWWSASVGLFLCVIQILAVELTLVWNNITDVQDLSSVGQLIPLIVGGGGLFRVLYVKSKQILKHGKIVNVENEDESRACPWADTYLEWKKCHARLGWHTINDSSSTLVV